MSASLEGVVGDSDESASERTVTETLRELPASERLFWKPTCAEQAAQRVYDKNHVSTARKLPDNEVITLALNEIAANHRRGFFFYLPSRSYWTNPESRDLLGGTSPERPGAAYPNIVYMHYQWTADMLTTFKSTGQRARYLHCNAISKPPADITPVYAIQYAGFANYELYRTATPSIVILATTDRYYVTQTDRLEAVVGRWSKRYRPGGPEPELRLNNLPYVWASDLAGQQQQQNLDELEGAKQQSLEEVYLAIERYCRPYVGAVPATMTAGQLRQVIPKPLSMPTGQPLGIVLRPGALPPSSDPPSRRGERRARQSRPAPEDAEGGVERRVRHKRLSSQGIAKGRARTVWHRDLMIEDDDEPDGGVSPNKDSDLGMN